MKYCLIIDNDDQQDQIDLLEKKSREQGFPITCYYFKPDKRECLKLEEINGVPEYIIDIDLLKNELEKEYKGKHIDLIASDYLLEDKFIDGLVLLQRLKDQWRGQNVPTLIYSSDSKMIKQKLQQEVKNVVEDINQLSDFLDNYYDNHPNETSSKGAAGEIPYIDDIIAFLKKQRNKTSLNYKLIQKLEQDPEKKFDNIFPRFSDKTLGQLSKMLKKNIEECDAFEDEFLDRCVDHFIYLKV